MEHIMEHGVGKNISSPIFLLGDFPVMPLISEDMGEVEALKSFTLFH
jgi:hypothetical protein